MNGDGAEPKAEPLRVPVSDVPVRNSIVAPEPEPGSTPMSMEGEPARRPSVVSHPVRYVSNHPSAPPAEAEPLELSEDLDVGPADAAIPEPGISSAGAEGDHEPPRERAASDTFDIEPMDVIESDDAEPRRVPRATMDLDPVELDAAEGVDAVPPPERPSQAQPPPPPERKSQAQPPPPPQQAGDLDIEVTDDEEQAAVVIDLTEDSSPPLAAASAGSDPPAPPSAAKPVVQTPPPPPPPTGRMSGAAHRVADLKPSKPRKHHWWEVFFDDDYLRSVRMPSREAVARKADFIEQRLGLVSGATVLDVGCGWGVDVVELSARGYLGVGMDLSLAMLSRAADEAQDRGQRINFLHADMREMNFDGTFDAVMCLGTTFGYFDDDMNRQVIERLHRALKPQGVLLIETVNRDHVIRSQPNLVWFEGDGCVCMEETEFNYFTSRLHVKRTVILDDGKQRENEYSVRLYSLHELGQMLHHQGFRVTEVSGRLAVPGVFFGQESPQLLVVAERRADGTGKHSLPPSGEADADD